MKKDFRYNYSFLWMNLSRIMGKTTILRNSTMALPLIVQEMSIMSITLQSIRNKHNEKAKPLENLSGFLY